MSRNWARAAEFEIDIQTALPLAAPIIGTIVWKLADASASASAKCPISGIIARRPRANDRIS